MFVRRTRTRATDGGSVYHTHRLVRSERDGGRVRQRTLLNLGRHFDIDRELWPLLCQRVEQILDGGVELFADASEAVETEAQRIAAQLLARGAAPADDAGGGVEAVAAAGERASWTTLRNILGGQQRVTATFRRTDGRTLHLRTATVAEPAQKAIYDALGIDPSPGGTRRTVV